MRRPSGLIRLSLMAAFCGVAGAGPIGARSAAAYDLTSKSPVNVDQTGLAIRGYDPVAYFTDSVAVIGDPNFTAIYERAAYHFASAAHRDMFVADPEKYLPQFGGFCAVGAAHERKANGDPTLWSIVDGKLYFNVNPKVNEMFHQNPAGNISQAGGNWSAIKDRTPGELFAEHPL